MGQALPTLHYLGNAIPLEDLPLLDNEFDLVEDAEDVVHHTLGGWQDFLNHYTGVAS